MLLLRFTSAEIAAGRAAGDERIDFPRRLDSLAGVGGLAGVGAPFEGSVLERTLGMAVLLEGPARDTSTLLAPIPLRTGVFTLRESSFDVEDPAVAPS